MKEKRLLLFFFIGTFLAYYGLSICYKSQLLFQSNNFCFSYLPSIHLYTTAVAFTTILLLEWFIRLDYSCMENQSNVAEDFNFFFNLITWAEMYRRSLNNFLIHYMMHFNKSMYILDRILQSYQIIVNSNIFIGRWW